MAKQHTVQLGECVSSISDHYGFFWDTVWNHANNAQLKAKRKDPNTLVPGDVVHIPDKRMKQEMRSTETTHRFQKKGVPARCRLQLFDGDEQRAYQLYEISIDGTKHKGATDADGVLDVPISPHAKRAHLVIGPDKAEFNFVFGRLQPVSELSGVQGRLKNLGYADVRVSGEMDEATVRALKQFQKEYGLTESGEADEATKSKLEELHDGVEDLQTTQTSSSEPSSETAQ